MPRGRFTALLRTELQHLSKIHPSDRPWQMAFTAALAMGLPLLVGAYWYRTSEGLVASLGGLTFLYLPNTSLSRRMVTLVCCALAMCVCYACGAIAHSFPSSVVAVLATLTCVVTMLGRSYGLGPPGSMFFIMAASIGAFSPVELPAVPHMVGALSMGALLACVLALLYSVYALRKRSPQARAPHRPRFDFVIIDSVLIGVFIGLALIAAQALQLRRPYWVPISCLAVIQGSSLHAIWSKQLQRILGTCGGILLAWSLLLWPLDKWTLTLALMTLCFIAEMLVVRHYALAVIFITPLAILLAEAANLGRISSSALIEARLVDTLLGCAVGLVGGVLVHNRRFKKWLTKPLRELAAQRSRNRHSG